MGFEDSDFEKAASVNSNNQLYKQAGNSIVVPVLEDIFENLFLQKRKGGVNMTNREIMIEELAREVLVGTFGNGKEREQRLGALYRPVQAKVDEIYWNTRRTTCKNCKQK